MVVTEEPPPPTAVVTIMGNPFVAVGAMQVIPATTDWISGVVGRRLNPLNAHDNATTGVVLLKILTRSASSERQAVAAYYQGLRSVRERGMYPDTRRYVANVMALKARFG